MDLIPFKEMDELFNSWLGLPEFEGPKMDFYETKDKIVAEVEMPGIDAKTIKVSVEDNFLKIEGRKEEKKEEKKKGYYRKEIKSGYLKRVVFLPQGAEGGKAKASYKNGILKVEVPKGKKRESKKKSIKVEI